MRRREGQLVAGQHASAPAQLPTSRRAAHSAAACVEGPAPPHHAHCQRQVQQSTLITPDSFAWDSPAAYASGCPAARDSPGLCRWQRCAHPRLPCARRATRPRTRRPLGSGTRRAPPSRCCATRLQRGAQATLPQRAPPNRMPLDCDIEKRGQLTPARDLTAGCCRACSAARACARSAPCGVPRPSVSTHLRSARPRGRRTRRSPASACPAIRRGTYRRRRARTAPGRRRPRWRTAGSWPPTPPDC